MKNNSKHIVLFFLFLPFLGFCQISPGDLSYAHAEFEGLSNCTLCHELGNKVSNAKCLDCHNNISNLLIQERGYHSSSEVIDEDCIVCHSDHHGRKFEMMRFDEDTFRHDLTGYDLTGQHKTIDCKKCHVSDFIQNEDLKQKPNTFLGLDQQCLNCHDDYHQETVSSIDCMSCHNTEAFTPAPNFDHIDTDYPLTGRHETVDCMECHEVISRNGKEIREFNNILSDDCNQCHSDPHKNNIKGSCFQCHTEQSFSNFIGRGNFNHDLTPFELKGSHQKIDCFDCHDRNNTPQTVFQNIGKLNENSCMECHNDIHEGKLGNNCVNCHNESSFSSLNTLDYFNHSNTDYALEGLHKTVDCKLCHQGKFTEAINFSACSNCHEDYHLGEFTTDEFVMDCVQCHTSEQEFEYSTYSLDDHQNAAYPLEGAHMATPCYACHISENEERWTFRDIGTECIDCHEDIHNKTIDNKYYPDNNCRACHVNEVWESVSFDHNLTNWPLEGKHLIVDCRVCHFVPTDNSDIFKQQFSDLNPDCVNCHQNIHDSQFEINGETDCKNCHTSGSWYPEYFNHSETAFKLDGRHAELACIECHYPSIENGQTIIYYQMEKFECIDCHQ